MTSSTIALILAEARPSTVHGMTFDERAVVIEAFNTETLTADIEFVNPDAAVVAYIRWTTDTGLRSALDHVGPYLACIPDEVPSLIVRAGCSWAIPQHDEIARAIDLATELAPQKEHTHA